MILRRFSGTQELADRLSQVVEVKVCGGELAGKRSVGIWGREDCDSLSFAAVSHGRVVSDTHSDVRFTVDRLSGGYKLS